MNISFELPDEYLDVTKGRMSKKSMGDFTGVAIIGALYNHKIFLPSAIVSSQNRIIEYGLTIAKRTKKGTLGFASFYEIQQSTYFKALAAAIPEPPKNWSPYYLMASLIGVENISLAKFEVANALARLSIDCQPADYAQQVPPPYSINFQKVQHLLVNMGEYSPLAHEFGVPYQAPLIIEKQ